MIRVWHDTVRLLQPLQPMHCVTVVVVRRLCLQPPCLLTSVPQLPSSYQTCKTRSVWIPPSPSPTTVAAAVSRKFLQSPRRRRRPYHSRRSPRRRRRPYHSRRSPRRRCHPYHSCRSPPHLHRPCHSRRSPRRRRRPYHSCRSPPHLHRLYPAVRSPPHRRCRTSTRGQRTEHVSPTSGAASSNAATCTASRTETRYIEWTVSSWPCMRFDAAPREPKELRASR